MGCRERLSPPEGSRRYVQLGLVLAVAVLLALSLPAGAMLVGPVGALGTRFYAGLLSDGETETLHCTVLWCPDDPLCLPIETTFTFEVALASADGGQLILRAPNTFGGTAQLTLNGPAAVGGIVVVQRDSCMEASVTAVGTEHAAFVVRLQQDL